MDLRALMALWAGKLTVAASRRLGCGGSTVPGRVARAIDPLLLRKLARQHRLGTIMVTGTNGKTTTCRMLVSILREGGYTVTHNRVGANLMSGITAAFAEAAPLMGGVLAGGLGLRRNGFRDIALAEVDEATVPHAVKELEPRLAAVTNFFRDQLDRYGELQRTVGLVRTGLGAGGKGLVLVLNADDPLVASLARPSGTRDNSQGLFQGGRDDRETVFYGLEIPPGAAGGVEEQTGDARHCVSCGRPYSYTMFYYAHLGHYSCPACGERRPAPQVSVIAAEEGHNSWRFQLRTPAGDVWVRLPVGGLYNLYNALAAAAAAFALGMPLQVIQQGLEKYAAGFGRMEVIPVKGREVCIALVKNPVGFNEVLRTILAGPKETEDAELRRLVIAINDNFADGRDISWLWDVDFEQMEGRAERFAFVVASGLRGEEMALRLKYAGFPVEKIEVEGDLEKALERAIDRTPEGSRLWLLPTYTALLEARTIIHRWGVAPHFWEV